MEFKEFAKVITQKWQSMQHMTLVRSDISGDDLWENYLSSFPEGSNPIYRERTEHDCSSCRQFIKAAGNMVGVENGKLTTIWDVEIGEHYQVVADALHKAVVGQPIVSYFLHTEKNAGVPSSKELLDTGEVVTWEHFHISLPSNIVEDKISTGTKLASMRTNAEVFLRGLDELTMYSVTTVLELIADGSLYRGEEHKNTLVAFQKHKKKFDVLSRKQKHIYAWEMARKESPSVTRVRNTSIGTLLVDLSENLPLDDAVKKFEHIVAPSNYKRPKALITKGMIEKAQKKVAELGLENSLQRRHAAMSDITINNVLFADRKATAVMTNVFDQLAQDVAVDPKKLSKTEKVHIDQFIEEILPKASSIELLMDNKLKGNLMSLLAPTDPTAPGMLKWGNNFSWSYAGDVTDSMKERVKAAGGDVTGDLRFSIQWNDEDVWNESDYDAHCVFADRHIDYRKKREALSKGKLDVDIMLPKKGVAAVENITFPDRQMMPETVYEFKVHNYNRRSGDSGFRAEIEFDGKLFSFNYPKPLAAREMVTVAKVTLTNSEFTLTEALPSSQSSVEIWGINTMQFVPVSAMMLSPNYWDDKAVGNKHYFFILDGCKQEGPVRGFYNEFLTETLAEHRKVFEVLGSKMMAEESNDQLSGLGFSSTQRNSVICRVTGSFTRNIEITF